MKKLLALVAIAGFLTIGITTNSYAISGNYDGEELALLIQDEEGGGDDAETNGGGEEGGEEVANGDDFKLSTEIKDGAYPKSFRPTEKEWSTIVLISSIIGLVILSAAIIIWRYRRKSS